MLVFETACRQYKRKTGQKVKLCVEDLHNSRAGATLSPQATQFASSMVRLHNDGFLSVVFTMSDFEGVGLLRAGMRCAASYFLLVSGHSERLTVLPFPPIPDADQVSNLLNIAVEVSVKEIQDEATKVTLKKRALRWLGKDHPIDHVILPIEQCKYIVDHLGSHMGDTIYCLREYLEKGRKIAGWLASSYFINNLLDAVNDRIEAPLGILQKALTADKEIRPPDVDRISFLATSHLAFQFLSAAPGEISPGVSPVFEAVHIMDKFPTLDPDSIIASVHRLVKMNLLSFIGNETTVALHSRKLKHTYKKLAESDAYVKKCAASVDAYASK